ncbi:Immunoglobulin, partial [Oryctes borbonicus]
WEETTELEYPRFVKQLSPVRVMDGENVTFTCKVVGKPIPKTEWFHNNQPVREAKDVIVSQDTEGVCMLSISEVFPENAGEYTCQAVNKIGEAICKTSLIVEAYEYVPDSEIGIMTGPSGSEEDLLADKTLSEIDFQSDSDVEYAPKITKKLPEVVSTKDGDVTRLEVKAVGKPMPKGRWLKHGEEIAPSNEFVIENFEDGTSILTISEVYPDDTGEIVYEAQNPLGVAVTTTELVVESVEGIIGTKEYRKPEWVTHMEELQAALKAAHSVPTFVKEITNIHTTEEEDIAFECIFSGTPTPDIIWYHNDKIIRNTEKVKVRIQDNKTTCKITGVTKEHVGTYVCKAISDIGLAVTKAKLYVQQITEEEKKEIQLKRAKEVEEKVKKERVLIEKRREERKKKRGIRTTEPESLPVDVTEVQTIEKVEEVPQKPEEEAKAQPIIPVQEPVSTEAIATCKKIDDTEEITETKTTAKEILSPQEPLEVAEIQPEDEIKDIKEKKPKTRKTKPETVQPLAEEATLTEVKLEEVIKRVEEIIVSEEIRMAKEVTEILDFIRIKEFGPGEHPLRELAEIGYLVRNGITVKEVNVLYHEDKFPHLKSPEAQSAMINVVERKGLSPLITEVLTEETTVDEKVLAETLGFRAFMKMVELKHATVEEVITQFVPDDFMQKVWETTEVTEETQKGVTQLVQVSEKTEVFIGESLIVFCDRFA